MFSFRSQLPKKDYMWVTKGLHYLRGQTLVSNISKRIARGMMKDHENDLQVIMTGCE